jgi:hypothetical protein
MEDNNNNIITSSGKYDKRGYCYADSYSQERSI